MQNCAPNVYKIKLINSDKQNSQLNTKLKLCKKELNTYKYVYRKVQCTAIVHIHVVLEQIKQIFNKSTEKDIIKQTNYNTE